MFMTIGIPLNRRKGKDETMTLEDKVRYGMMAVGGTAAILATLGLHFSPLDIVGSYGD